MRKRSANVAAAMFYLCESATAATKRPVGTEINHTLWSLILLL
ncbi:hypothetical protein [Lysinibacillus xylanilyticus]|uniref:Uncharacterized protein n=1 Tax=Lysinibacillus xylanilyticus TaxID=582475 RepID=A0ABV3VT44_9BACI